MVSLKLMCMRLGEGSLAEVEIESSRTALALKEKIKHQLFSDSDEVFAPDMKLFLARTTVGTDDRAEGAWLQLKDPLVPQIRRGEIPQEMKELYMKDEIEDPADALSAILPSSFPKTGVVHVLVYLTLKRRRLENTQHFVQVPRINLKGAEYVTLPGEFVAKCGLNPGGDLMLYCRRQVHELWEFLRDEVVAKNTRGWILGPPGTGKSVGTLSFLASLDQEEWSVIWIHLDEMGDFCLSMKAKKHWLVDDRRTFELHRYRNESCSCVSMDTRNVPSTRLF